MKKVSLSDMRRIGFEITAECVVGAIVQHTPDMKFLRAYSSAQDAQPIKGHWTFEIGPEPTKAQIAAARRAYNHED